MTASTHHLSTRASCATIIHRELGGITGLREIFDRRSRLAVWAFPFSAIDQFAAKLMATAAAYILADHRSIYVGESSNVGRRLLEHASDDAKMFAREVFVVSTFDSEWFDKTSAVQLQHRLTHNAKTAGLVEVRLGTNPQDIALPTWLLDSNDSMFDAAPQLLFDAGCRAFHSNCDSQRNFPAAGPTSAPSGDADAGESDDSGLMEIGVTTTPRNVDEYQLVYFDLWARGYQFGDRFIVAAGSDFHNVETPSVNEIIKTRRKELLARGVLQTIRGISDRKRSMVAIAFPSMAIAAKVLCGAHVDSSKWQLLRVEQPIMLTA
jgi:predicted GIY-YIG superfamily endonuclease